MNYVMMEINIHLMVVLIVISNVKKYVVNVLKVDAIDVMN